MKVAKFQVIALTFFTFFVISVASAQVCDYGVSSTCPSPGSSITYNFDVPQGSRYCISLGVSYSGSYTFTATVIPNSGQDADLYVYVNGNYGCSSSRGTGETDSCSVSVTGGDLITVEIYGFSAGGANSVSGTATISLSGSTSTTTTTTTTTTATTTCPNPSDTIEIYDGYSACHCVGRSESNYYRYTPSSSLSSGDITVRVEPLSDSDDPDLYLYACDPFRCQSAPLDSSTHSRGRSDSVSYSWDPFDGITYFKIKVYGFRASCYNIYAYITESTPATVTPTTTTTPTTTPTTTRTPTTTPTTTTTPTISSAPSECQCPDWVNGVPGACWFWCTLIWPVIQVVLYPINAFYQFMVTTFGNIYNTLTQAVNSVLQPISALFDSISSAIDSMIQSMAPHMNMFIAIFLAVLGVFLIAFTSRIPILNILTTIVGWTLILFGAYYGMLTVFGEQLTATVIGWALLAIWGVGTVIILYYEVVALRR